MRDNVQLQVNTIENDNAIPVSEYIEDRTSPILETFGLNLTSEVLPLTFDETVDTSSVDVKKITIKSDNSSDSESQVPLTNGYVSEDDSTIIHINLIDFDLHAIKRKLDLATDINNACVRITEDNVFDMAEDPNGMTDTTLCTRALTEDFVRPQLVEFGVNVNISELYLRFDEPIDLESINISLITLQSVMDTTAAGTYKDYTLTGGNASSVDLLLFIITMTNDDLNEINHYYVVHFRLI